MRNVFTKCLDSLENGQASDAPCSAWSMEKHLFLTGEKGVGKSTALRKLAEETGLKLGGFVTRKEEDGAVYILPVDAEGNPGISPDPAHRLFGCLHREPDAEIAERFNTLGCLLLKDAEREAECIIMDELGPAERLAFDFQEAVLRILDGDKPVLGVLQRCVSPFIERIKRHPKVSVVEMPL